MFATNFHFCQILTRHGRIDIHWDICKVTGSHNDGWLIHAVLARCIYGPQTHKVDEATRVRTPYRNTGDNITKFSFPDDRKFCTQGIKNIISEDKDLEPQQSWEDIADGSYYSTSRFTESFATRLGLGEIRVLTQFLCISTFN